MKMFGLNTPTFSLNVQLTIEIVKLFKSLTSILVVIFVYLVILLLYFKLNPS